MKKILLVIFLYTSLFTKKLDAQKSNDTEIKIANTFTEGYFPLVGNNNLANIYVDSTDASVVQIAANCFKNDVQLITGKSLPLQNAGSKMAGYAVIVGTLHHSKLIDGLIANNKLPTDKIEGKWETYYISVLKNPMANVPQALVIIGSDPRGTAFGIFELSKKIGVSPWYWWADVIPEHKPALYLSPTTVISNPPSVQYRGIFINDEDWGMQPWAAKHIDTDIKDIGPNTYAHIFELLLRLKANYLWPAMHPCTKPFYHYFENARVADKYAIVVGASHCEPMQRSNIFEWSDNFKNEYGVAPGEWRYDKNPQQIKTYWDDRIKQIVNYESTITVGMRGIHDGSMPGPPSQPEKVKLLSQVISDQREILQQDYKRPINQIPQIFVPYKEVLNLYKAGAAVPEDVSIIWADDNYGYIRQVSNTDEQKRSGGSGVYYHFSYWGAPRDFLWLSTISPALTAYEMGKAFAFNGKKLWVFNVGDLKPAEMEINFAMDLAYDATKWNAENAHEYAKYWASETFGKEFADSIAAIKTEYYRLAAEGKPEQLDMINYDDIALEKRIKDYATIVKKVQDLSLKIPKRLADAYFELVMYPVDCAFAMNEKILWAKKAWDLEKKGEFDMKYGVWSMGGYEKIKSLTEEYNTHLANGKWESMMSWKPRNLPVFDMPKLPTKSETDSMKRNLQKSPDSILPKAILAADFNDKKDVANEAIKTIEGLGIGGKGVTILPITAPPFTNQKITDMPYVEYKLNMAKGERSITLKVLPTQNINNEYGLHYAISVNGGEPQIQNFKADVDGKLWAKNVVNGYASNTTKHNVGKDGEAIIRLYLLEPGLVVNKIEWQ